MNKEYYNKVHHKKGASQYIHLIGKVVLLLFAVR